MRRWLKRLTLGVALLLLLVALFVAAAYDLVGLRLRKRYDVPADAPATTTPPPDVERGRHMALAVAKCMLCHGDDLGGAVLEDDPVFARLVASNLTRGRGGVGRTYSTEDWSRAIRHGVDPNGRPLVFMPAAAFWRMSDRDLADLLAFLQTVPAVDRELPPTRIGPVGRIMTLLVGFPPLPAERIDHRASRRPPEPAADVAYGDYLATIGGCRECHGPQLHGNGMPGAPELTRGRLGEWTEADFFHALRSGVRPDGTPIQQTMPWIYAGKMTDEEIRAVWMYVRSVPPRPSAN